MYSINVQKFEGDGSDWDDFVYLHPDSRIEHLYAWKNIIADSYDIKNEYICSITSNKISGILPLFYVKSCFFGNHLVSLPFLDYGGILVNNKYIVKHLHDFALSIAHDFNSDDLIYRHDRKMISDLDTFSNKVTFIIDLKGSKEALWKNISSERRNRVKKAQKLGLTTCYGDKDDLNTFYKIWSGNMRDLGSPVHSKHFFKNILDYLPENSGIILVKNSSNEIIGCGLFLKYRDTISLPWVSSRKKYFHLYPNNILYWDLMADHAEKGYKSFDFGRSSVDSGTYHFKKRWKAEQVPLFWEASPLKSNSVQFLSQESSGFKPLLYCWRHTPIWLTNIIGPCLRKGLIN